MTTIVAASDTHGLHREVVLPEGDVLIHCGDMTMYGEKPIYLDTFKWLCEQTSKFKHVICILGNHDKYHQYWLDLVKTCDKTNFHYLENSGIELDGIKYYGCPNVSNLPRWAFNDTTDPTCWERIPDEVEVLISHSPPYRILDEVWQYGSKKLRLRVDELMNKNLKVNVFGHTHEDGGKKMTLTSPNIKREVLFVNAAICDIRYKATNPPMQFEV